MAAERSRRSESAGAAHDPYTSAEVDIPIITWRYASEERQGVWMRAERLNHKYDYVRGFRTTIIGETGAIEVLGEGGGQGVHAVRCTLAAIRSANERRPVRVDEIAQDERA